MLKKIALAALVLAANSLAVQAQERTNVAVLNKTSKQLKESENQNFSKALELAKEKGWPVSYKVDAYNIAFLIGVDALGQPIYYRTQSNVVAAATTRANALWPGGSSGLNLTGGSANIAGKLAIWDGGSVFSTHVELNGRVSLKEPSSAVADHPTHVAGTMIASGVNPSAKGMAYQYNNLLSYNFSNDASEMAGEAAGLLLSNHSYGANSGWVYNSNQNRWEWWGLPGATEDYKFGYYDNSAMMYDSLAYNAPFYLIVKSAGNNRSDNGPVVGQNYWRLSASGSMVSAGPRPAGISDNNGYDIIPTAGTAKNILTVGAVNGIANGYAQKEDVVISSFSSYGPTDDGRIKPDVVADGVNVLSSTATTENSYSSFSGTSMASPNATGSLLLLQEYYSQLHAGAFMRSATLKALAIHTADEAGDTPGPDYRFGWGLLNVARAADVIKANNSGSHLINERVLNNGSNYTTSVVASGSGPLVVTIVWTDPKGQPEPTGTLNSPAKKLVNDLDVRVTSGSTSYNPWKLDPFNPGAPATTGDNSIDNVEKITIANPTPGQTYTITITHKGSLERGSQAYSLVVSGAGGQAYCSSAPSGSGGSRIDNVTFGGINKTNVAGCTTYSNFTTTSTTLEPGQTLPVSVKVNSCDASNNPKVVKVYIDYNGNGNFTDAGELAATSGVLNNNSTFTANVTVPNTVTPGLSTIMRVIVSETSDPSGVSPCGAYTAGETQDYSISFITSSNDVSINDVSFPEGGTCANPNEYPTIRIKNSSTQNKTNLPLVLNVRNGGTIVRTYTALFKGIIYSNSTAEYTFSTPFATTGGTNYTYEAIVTDPADPYRLNDTLRKTISIATPPPAPAGQGVVCGSNVSLRVTNPVSTTYTWYSDAAATVPVAFGAATTTSTITPNRTYYLSQGGTRASIGPVNKTQYGSGGYNTFSGNSIRLTADVPVTIETSRLYIGTAGTIKFVVNPMASATSYYPALGDSVTLNVYPTSPNTPALATTVNDPQDTGAIYRLDLKLDNSVSNNYLLRIFCENGASIFRNNPIATNPYPVGFPGLLTVTSNSVTEAGDPNAYQKYWYFFYDTKVSTINACPSPLTTVVASVVNTPTITQVGDTLISSADNGNQWYVGGLPIAGATDKKYKPLQSGVYSVAVTGALGCQQFSNTINVVVTAVNPVVNASVGFQVSPNPSRGIFKVRFSAATRDDLKLEIINAQGQPVYVKTLAKYVGQLSEDVNINYAAAGVYVIRLQHGNKIYYNKVLIEK